MQAIVILLFLRTICGDPRPIMNIMDNEIPQMDSRIVGGSTTLIENHPYVASLQVQGHIICTGSILTEYFILSAAHCFDQYEVRWLSVGVGGDGYIRSSVHQVHVFLKHKNYRSKSQEVAFDVAVAELKTPVQYGKTVKPVCLYQRNEVVKPGIDATVVGYGQTETQHSTSQTLREVRIPVISRSICEYLYKVPRKNFLDGKICAGIPRKGACKGDSGGPLMIGGRQAGIVSWSLKCKESMLPGFFTDVAAYRGWIEFAVRKLGGPRRLPTDHCD